MTYFNLYVDGQEGFYVYLDEKDEFEIGDQVLVLFAGRKRTALIVSENPETEYKFKINKIREKLDSEIKFTKELIKLFLWMREYYVTGFVPIMETVYPKKVKIQIDKFYRLVRAVIPANPKEEEFYKYINKKEIVKEKTIFTRFGKTFISEFINKGILEEVERKIARDETKNDIQTHGKTWEFENNIKLTEEQLNAKKEIIDTDKRFFLLKGVTGSGKTEVYIELIKDALKNGKGAMFLVPEISLTPQMINRFKLEFQEHIAILHSKLSQGERHREWLNIYNNKKQIVLGVRSAVFAPVKNLKYIIIDEEHETTYKQDSNPRYNAKLVAIKRAELENSKVIMGSATPSVESYYFAEQDVFKLIEMNKRYNNAKLPSLKLVDMKEENDEFFSKELLKETLNRLKKGEQVVMLLNRKGYSTFIQCKTCGYTEECPNCAVSMNYYLSDKRYKCNYCGYSKSYSSTCPECGGKDLKYSGKGTEKIEEELERYFEGARILRVDAESVKKKDSFDKIYHDFLEKKYDILLGTQMISKGLHFPNVTLVGIISADTILGFPDFRAGEKTFQLVSQAAGRAGRGDKAGEVVIQTYQPEHYVIQKIVNDDYEGLYKEEIEARKVLHYPPFSRIINVILSALDVEMLEKKAVEFYKRIEVAGLEFHGPMPAPISRIKNRYRYQIFIKGDRKSINKFKRKLYNEVMEFKSNSLRITVDVDPINLI